MIASGKTMDCIVVGCLSFWYCYRRECEQKVNFGLDTDWNFCQAGKWANRHTHTHTYTHTHTWPRICSSSSSASSFSVLGSWTLFHPERWERKTDKQTTIQVRMRYWYHLFVIYLFIYLFIRPFNFLFNQLSTLLVR